MPFDIKKYLTPKYLLIGGIAVVGGLFLATKFRPKASAPSEEATVIAMPISQPYGVDTNPEEYRANAPVTSPAAPGQSGDKAPGTNTPKPAPTLPPSPGRGSNTGPVPTVPIGTPIPIGQPAAPAPLPGTPRRDTTPPAPGPPPATPNVPGGFPADCRDVQHRPADHPGSDPLILVRAKGGDRLARTIATEWALIGIAAMPGALGLNDIAVWLTIPINWSVGNRYRRARGLRAMTETEWKSARDTVNAMNRQNLTKPLNDAQLRQLWNTYHLPYLCG